MTNNNRTVVVTGASSGVGLEAAAQFARAGYGRVIVTARTDAKAQRTRADVRAPDGFDVFEALPLDLDDLASVSAAAQVADDIDRIATQSFQGSRERAVEATGSLHHIQMDHFDNPPAQRAFWNVVENITHADAPDFPAPAR